MESINFLRRLFQLRNLDFHDFGESWAIILLQILKKTIREAVQMAGRLGSVIFFTMAALSPVLNVVRNGCPTLLVFVPFEEKRFLN